MFHSLEQEFIYQKDSIFGQKPDSRRALQHNTSLRCYFLFALLYFYYRWLVQ